SSRRARSSDSDCVVPAARRSGGASPRSMRGTRGRAGRLLRDGKAFRVLLVTHEKIANREQHGEPEKRARREDCGENAAERQLDAERILCGREQQPGAGEQGALACDLAQSPERDEHAAKSEPRCETASCRYEDRLTAGDRLRLCKDRAIRDDQRNE